MKKYWLATLSFSLLGLGCAPKMAPKAIEQGSTDREGLAIALSTKTPAATPAFKMREPGDFVVYRFSGSYRDAPVTLTQRVVKREHGWLIVDITIDEAGSQQRLRMRIGEEGERKGELISVARLEGNVQVPFGVAAFERLMNEIMLTADENMAMLQESSMQMDVAGASMPCTATSYRVRVGALDAVMTTVSSPQFQWGDVGGEIATSDGRVLYKAEIVDAGDASRDSASVAASEAGDVYEEDYDHFEE